MNFGTARTVNEVRLYFKDSRPASTTYRAPSSYNIQYLYGSTWTNVGNQTKSPATPVGNYNRVQFTPVSTQRIRVLMTNASGAKSGLTEIKIVQPGRRSTRRQPTGNLALSATRVVLVHVGLGELRGHQQRRSSRPARTSRVRTWAPGGAPGPTAASSGRS